VYTHAQCCTARSTYRPLAAGCSRLEQTVSHSCNTVPILPLNGGNTSADASRCKGQPGDRVRRGPCQETTKRIQFQLVEKDEHDRTGDEVESVCARLLTRSTAMPEDEALELSPRIKGIFVRLLSMALWSSNHCTVSRIYTKVVHCTSRQRRNLQPAPNMEVQLDGLHSHWSPRACDAATNLML
jgi:hypothetical protein